MSGARQKYFNMYANSKGPDQTAHKCSLIRIFAVALRKTELQNEMFHPCICMKSYNVRFTKSL